ncbi:MAG: AAA family ATPase [Lachnospiraceae bacterium]|nr:AAA family ATPase [Lachnospiraceae bacterium]
MINKLEINNLKCIKNMQMECRNLNVLVGTNSSGKSTIQQALLLVGQNLETVEGLNGKLVELGSFEDAKCIYSAEKELKIALRDDENHYVVKKFRLSSGTSYEVCRERTAEEEYEGWIDKLSIKKRNFQYLSCHRIGPCKAYKKNMTLDDVIGVDGEYAMSYLNQHGKDLMELPMCKGNVDYTLLGQVNWWLSYITDSTIMTEDISGTDLIKVSYQMNDMERIRPDNIGAGISYLIAVLVVCLSSPEKGVLIIENPEIHLHPSAQAKVCEFLYFIAATGRQIFVETHSDHIVNGFRGGIATGSMQEELINIQFVYLNEQHVAEAFRVKIGKRGRIENQRKDLFDQFDMDLNKMIGL